MFNQSNTKEGLQFFSFCVGKRVRILERLTPSKSLTIYGTEGCRSGTPTRCVFQYMAKITISKISNSSKIHPSESFFLLSGFAQKINAPLKSLLLSSQKVLNTYKTKDFEYVSYKDFQQMMTTMEQMNKQIKRCYDIAQRLSGLDKSKIKREFCGINGVINDILGLLDQQFSVSRIKVNVRLKKGIPNINLSRLDGHQVVYNVIINAIQAMPGGGIIKIRTLYERKIRCVVIDISDEGIGITPKHLSRIFEPFFTTREHGVEKSSGLGLSIVYAIVQAAGGEIDIQSSLRKGTQVRIFLPAATV